MKEKLKDRDVLLVKENGSDKLQAVTGLNEDGTPKTVKPEEKNEPEFLRIDKHGNALENFISNFLRQCKDPTHFQFFSVPLEKIENTVSVLQEMLKNPETPSNKEMLDSHRILPEAFAPKPYEAIDESRIDWEQFGKLGISKEMIDPKSLDKLLNWQKTPVLFPIHAEIAGTVVHTDARLSLRENEDGKLNLVIHAVRNEPQLDGFVYGVRLPDDVKQNLKETGHAGRLLEIEPVKGQKMQAVLSIDKLTNEVVALRADRIKIPEEIKGVTLNEQQKKDLSEGKAVKLEGMTSKNGKEFNATVQINADRRGLEFRFDNTNQLPRQQSNKQAQSEGIQFHIPRTLLGVALSEQQQKALKENKTIYVGNMMDRAGQPFNAYVKVNAEKGKLDFYKWNPDVAKKQGAKVTPDNAGKTQVAVNSEGKTNEATKKAQANGEPLKQGQVQPTEKQQEKQEKKVVKSKGMKM